MMSASDNDALPIEYKLANRKPGRQVDISYFIGDASRDRFLRPQVSRLQEQPVDFVLSEKRMPLYYL